MCVHCGGGIQGAFHRVDTTVNAALPGQGARASVASVAGDAEKAKRRGKVHAECWEDWRASRLPRCIHCAKPVLGTHYDVPDGQLHEQCWAPWSRARKDLPKCAHCGEDIDGRHYDADGAPVHIDCWTPYLAAMPTEAPAAPPEPFSLGWFYKRAEQSNSWRRRWAEVVNGHLFYFATATATAPKGCVPLAGASLDQHVFLPASGSPRGFGVVRAAFELRGYLQPDDPAKGERVLLFIVDQAAHAKAGGEGLAADVWGAVLPGAIARATNPPAADAADAAPPTAIPSASSAGGRSRQATLLELGRNAAPMTIPEDEIAEDGGDEDVGYVPMPDAATADAAGEWLGGSASGSASGPVSGPAGTDSRASGMPSGLFAALDITDGADGAPVAERPRGLSAAPPLEARPRTLTVTRVSRASRVSHVAPDSAK